MKSIIWTMIVLILILSVSYIVFSSDYTFKTFVINGNQENTETSFSNLKTFTILQEPTGRSQLVGIKEGSKCARERNRIYTEREEEIQKCIDKITKNWKRTYGKMSYEKVYGKDGEFIEGHQFWEKKGEFYGFNEDEDASLRFNLRNRALNGEKIC